VATNGLLIAIDLGVSQDIGWGAGNTNDTLSRDGYTQDLQDIGIVGSLLDRVAAVDRATVTHVGLGTSNGGRNRKKREGEDKKREGTREHREFVGVVDLLEEDYLGKS